MRKLFIASLLFGAALASGYAGSRSPDAVEPPMSDEAKPAAADGQSQLNEQIVAALQSGHYADAIQTVRRSRVSQAEIDFAVGEIVLQGLADPAATQLPVESLDEAIALMEKSAVAGHRPAISALAAAYYTGLHAGTTNAVLIAPDAPLQACWEAAKTDPKQSASCVAMRLNRR